MTNTKTNNLGIWMDHANAFLTEFTAEPMTTTKLESAFTHEQKEASLIKSEQLSHNKEQHEQASFYKKLGEVILLHTEVLLFGPTDAKVELHNMLKADHHFDNIKIEVKNTDKMNEGEQQRFVRSHFSKKY